MSQQYNVFIDRAHGEQLHLLWKKIIISNLNLKSRPRILILMWDLYQFIFLNQPNSFAHWHRRIDDRCGVRNILHSQRGSLTAAVARALAATYLCTVHRPAKQHPYFDRGESLMPHERKYTTPRGLGQNTLLDSFRWIINGAHLFGCVSAEK